MRVVALVVVVLGLLAAPAFARDASVEQPVRVLDVAGALVPSDRCGGTAAAIATLPPACFVPARTLAARGDATIWNPATNWYRLPATDVARSGVPWMLVVPTYITDGELAVADARGRIVWQRPFGAEIPVADRDVYAHDIFVPLHGAEPGGTIVVRVRGPFSLPRALRLQTVSSIDAGAAAAVGTIALPLAFLNGGTLLMGFYNLLVFAVLRRRIYLLYAASILAVVFFQLVETGAAWTVLWPHLSLRDDYPPYLAWLVYVVLIVWFSRDFLELPRVAPVVDRVLRAAVVLVAVDSAIYVAIPDALVATGTYAWLDPLVTAVLFGTMLAGGVVAYRRGVAGALSYLLAFGGSAVGIIAGEVVTYLPQATLRELAYFPSCAGVAWESVFLALGLGIRLRESEREAARLADYAYRDGLTGIANRRAFDDAFAREWSRAKRTGASIAVAIFDIDHFKAFNDRYGHQAGDETLVAVAIAVAGAARREGDIAARYGGEEFVLLLPNTGAEGAFAIAEAVRERVAAVPAVEPVTVSAGLAVAVAGEGADARALLAQADSALYAAKIDGRNRTVRANTTAAPR